MESNMKSLFILIVVDKLINNILLDCSHIFNYLSDQLKIFYVSNFLSPSNFSLLGKIVSLNLNEKRSKELKENANNSKIG